jgi:EAL domain-containing protein (putative c-di-GMP-specific phosphodiesterase class I)
METKIRARKGLERDLHKALGEGQLALAYQPQMDIRTGALSGMEALLRWNHPERGMVPPAEFIPIAEATGLIVPIGEWALREACRQNKAWQDAGLPALTVAVNLSAAQFLQENLVETVEAVIRDTGLDPVALQIEITESLFIQDGARDTLLDFRQRGIGIALDDFGTGYSSLSYLTRFPIDKIKLDRSFVQDIRHDTSSAAIIQAVVNLGHSLGMRVNVEGVEAADDLAILSGYGVDEVQGYYIGQPLSADAFAEFTAQAMAPAGELPKSA